MHIFDIFRKKFFMIAEKACKNLISKGVLFARKRLKNRIGIRFFIVFGVNLTFGDIAQNKVRFMAEFSTQEIQLFLLILYYIYCIISYA